MSNEIVMQKEVSLFNKFKCEIEQKEKDYADRLEADLNKVCIGTQLREWQEKERSITCKNKKDKEACIQQTAKNYVLQASKLNKDLLLIEGYIESKADEEVQKHLKVLIDKMKPEEIDNGESIRAKLKHLFYITNTYTKEIECINSYVIELEKYPECLWRPALSQRYKTFPSLDEILNYIERSNLGYFWTNRVITKENENE
jgi:hypothetical protein